MAGSGACAAGRVGYPLCFPHRWPA